MKLSFFKSRRFRQGSLATAITVLTVALIVVLNMVLSVLSTRYGLNVDLTAEKLFSISDESKEFLGSLERDVAIYVLNSEDNFLAGGTYYVQANEVLKNYARTGERVTVQYIDTVKNPNFMTQYADLQPSANNILVTSGDNAVVLTATDLFNYQTYYFQSYIASSKAEQAMATAILNVTSDKKIRVVFLQGHNEYSMDSLEALLQTNNYEISYQNLLTEEVVDPEATVAILASPMRDLTEEELRKLDAFLSNDEKLGKTLVYFAGSEQPELPNMEDFLADWGARPQSGIVFENNSQRTLAGNPFLAVVDYMEEEYSHSAMSKSLLPLTAYARPLTITFENKSYIGTQSLLEFSETAAVRPIEVEEGWTAADAEQTGPFPTLVLGTMLKYEGTTPIRSNVLISGSHELVGDTFLSMNSVANSEYFLGLLGSLSGKEDSIVIQDKTRGYTYMETMSTGQANAMALIFVIILPLAVLVIGMVIWLRRRHR